MSANRGRRWTRPTCPTALRAYRTQGAALHALLMVRQGNAQAASLHDIPVPREPIGCFHCPRCTGWHLTTRLTAETVLPPG